MARLRPGVTRAHAQAALRALARQIKLEVADPSDRARIANDRATLRLIDGSQGFNFARNRFGSPLTVLMGIAGLVLLIACANLANLLLARASSRQKEFAMRLSLGASRFRIVRQLFVESFALAACGGLLGLIISFWLVRSLLAYLNEGTSASRLFSASPDPVLLSFCAALSLTTTLLFGLVPAWQSSKPDILPALKEASGTSTPAPRAALLQKSLIVFQLALSLVILFAAGLLTRTLRHLQTIDLGFRPAKVVVFSVDPAMNGYSAVRVNEIFDEILARLRAQSGVRAASFAMSTPLEGSLVTLGIELPGHTAGGPSTTAAFNMISPGYFATLNQPFLAGRDFSDRDGKSAPRVAIVNERFVSEYMAGQNPIGRHFTQRGGDVEIVGVVKTSPFQTVRETPQPGVYVPAKQSQSSGYTFLVQTTSDAARLIPGIQHSVHSIDPKLPIYNVRTLEAQIDRGISSERILSFLSSLFSILAILLSGIGLYGIVAYSVSRRTREIGVRFAIGAQKSDVAGLFLREGLAMVAAGIALGIPVALASARVLKNLLYGLQPTDALTLAVMTAVLILAALLATFMPVRRAAAIEPLQALRYE
jgi:predicted permease